MGSPRARPGLGVRDRGGDGLLYSPPRLFSTKYACNAQYTSGPSSLHDPVSLVEQFESTRVYHPAITSHDKPPPSLQATQNNSRFCHTEVITQS